MENLNLVSLDSTEIFEINGGRPGPAYTYGLVTAAYDFCKGFLDGFNSW